MNDAIAITVDDSRVKALFGRLSEAGGSPPMRAVADELEQLARQSFHNEASPWGAPWPALSPLTLRARRRAGNANHRKLFDTGAMFGSLRSAHDRDSATVSVGEGMNDPRAVVHQFGANGVGRGRNGVIPARPFLPADGALPDAWWQRVRAPVEKALEAARK